MTNKKWFLDLWFFGFCPLACLLAPVSTFTPVLIALIITLSLLWMVLRIADAVDRRSIGLIGQVLK